MSSGWTGDALFSINWRCVLFNHGEEATRIAAAGNVGQGVAQRSGDQILTPIPYRPGIGIGRKKQPPFPRPPIRPDGWFRGLPQKQIPSRQQLEI